MSKESDGRKGAGGKKGERAEGEELPDRHENEEVVCAPKALTKPERVRILAIALDRPISPSEYARERRKDISRIAYDFRCLRDDGYIELVEEVPVGGSVKHMYRATKRGLVSDAEWRLYNAAVKAGFREATLRDFVARAAEAIAAGTFDAKDNSNFSWKAIRLDEEGWVAFARVMKRAYDEVMAIEAQSAERAERLGTSLFAATFAIAGFLSPEPQVADAQERESRKPAGAREKARDRGRRGARSDSGPGKGRKK